MPLLMYECAVCINSWEVLVPMEPEPTECPQCGHDEIDRARDLEVANVDGETTVGKRLK